MSKESTSSGSARIRTRTVAATPMRATLDRDGVIIEVTDAWNAFTRAHGGDVRRCGVGVSYLAVCDADPDDPVTTAIAMAIRGFLDGTVSAARRFLLPCPGAGRSGWFELTVDGVPWAGRGRGATVTVAETDLYVTDRGLGEGGLSEAFLRAAHRRNQLVAAELHRMAAHQLFAITLGVGSLAERAGSAAHRRQSVALLEDLDRVIRQLLALSALLDLSHRGPHPS